MSTLLPLESFPEHLRRNVDPASPAPMRLVAARGLVPAGPAEMAMLLYQLAHDPEAPIASAARKTLADSPLDLMENAAGADIDGRVLGFLADLHAGSEKVLERVFSNRNTLDDAFIRHAETCSESISELIAINEVRVLRSPKIIEKLYMNANARMSTIDRLMDLAKRHGVRFEMQAMQNVLDDPGYDTTAVLENAIEQAGEGDELFRSLLAESLAGDDDADADDSESPDDEEEERVSSNIATQILAMTISQKMRLAMLGSKAERDFLIKDNNRLVYMAAVTSPKVRLKDITNWSGNRLMPDGVLSFISTHRRYRRVYQIVANLTSNPKTPLKDALKLMPQLVKKDLATLVKNRNVSHNLRRQAKALQEQRAKKR